MPLSVGQLAVELEARTQEFRTRMHEAERRISSFERSAGASTRRAGLSFRSLIGPIAAVGAALGALAAVRGVKNIAEGAVEGAAAFEGYEVRLRTLLGSQEAANRSLETFVNLSTRTPFAVSQIVAGATTLSAAAGGSRAELEELTLVASNLAAVTGLKFEEAAGNLQRSLAAGIASADLFRERGVRQLIEDINGIPDLTKLSLEDQRQAFKDTFGSGTLAPYGRAAQDLSATLGGSLSNIGDAADNARRSLGEALSPAVFATARGVVIPFFESVKSILDENQEAITDFAVGGLARLIRGFGGLLDTGADILDFLDRWGIQLDDLGNILGILREAFSVFFEAVRVGFNAIVSGVALLAEGVGKVGRALGLISDDDVRRLEQFRTQSFEKLAEDAAAFGENAVASFQRQREYLAELTDEGESYSDRLRAAGDFAKRGATELERQATAFRKVRREQAAAEDEAAAAAARRAREATQVDVAALKRKAEVRETLRLVEEAERRFASLTGEGEGPRIRLPDEDLLAASEAFSFHVTEGLQSGLDRLLAGGGLDWAESFAELSAGFFEDAMNDALEGLRESFSKLFQSLAPQVSGLFGGEGGGLNLGAGFGAAIGLGGQLLSGALRGTGATVRNALVQSTVTSSRAVRGVVAGPTSIPIAEVGNAIRDAQGAQVAEIRRSNALLQAILNAIRTGEGAPIDFEQALSDLVSGELNGSVALG